MTNDDRFDNAFCNELADFLNDYEGFLISSKGLTQTTVNKHRHLISAFLWFINHHTAVAGFEDITKVMLNSRFRADLQNNDPGKFSDSFVKHALKGFFSFIYTQHGISTPLLKKEFNLR